MTPPVKIWRAVLVLVSLTAAVALVLAALTYNHSRTDAARIRHSQLESCQKVGDPINKALIQVLRDQVTASRNVKPSLFPNIPKREFLRLVREQQTKRLRVLAKLQRVPTCEQRFGN